MTSYANETVGKIAAEHPASTRLFEKLGIDYCCGGKLPLGQACEQANIPLEKALAMLEALDQNAARQDERQWTEATAVELIAHIIGKHHAFVRAEIPRLEGLLAKVNGRHGSAHAELARIQELFGAVAQELQTHMFKEERILFPHIEQLDSALRRQGGEPASCFGSVEFPIARMIADHDDAGELFRGMRQLSNGYAPPADACASFTALYRGLEEFEQDLHRHIHLENNILFPRALEMERSLREAAHAG